MRRNHMDYLCIYKNIIEKARTLEQQRIKEQIYTEEHHIVPRCMGGTNVSSNLVNLTPREHFICHWLLFKHYKDSKLAHAFFSMVYGPRFEQRKQHGLRISSIVYEAARNAHVNANKVQGSQKYHKEPARFELPIEWHSKVEGQPGIVSIINVTSKCIERVSIEQACELTKTKQWKYLNQDRKKIYNKTTGDSILVDFESELLCNRNWEFSKFTSNGNVRVIENDQGKRWLLNCDEVLPTGFKYISSRYIETTTRKTVNLYDDDPILKTDQYKLIKYRERVIHNKVTNEYKIISCSDFNQYSDEWEYATGKSVIPKTYIHKVTKQRTKFYNFETIPDGFITLSEYDQLFLKPIRDQKRHQKNEMSGKIIGSVLKNINTGKSEFIKFDDPRRNDPNWKGTKHGQINLKNQQTEEIICVSVDDPRRSDPDWKPLAYRKAAFRNVHTGERKYLNIDDARLSSGEWISTSKGWSTYQNVITGERASYGKDDPRYNDPNWVSIYKGCNDNVPDKICPYCGTICHHGKGYTRWHGENCKNKNRLDISNRISNDIEKQSLSN